MKPLIAVSRCLLGEAVRYDGCARPVHWITHELARQVDFLPFCPEVAAGLGVPRSPVRLIRKPSGMFALGVDNPDLDVTNAILSWTWEFLARLPAISACIIKARSPSCGYLSTPLFDTTGNQLDRVSGLFTTALQQRMPGLLILDEEMLRSDDGKQVLLRALNKQNIT